MTESAVPKPLAAYTHWCPEAGPALLDDVCTVARHDATEPSDPDAFDTSARDAAAICYFVPDYFDAQRIARFPNLRILAGFGKGYDNIDVEAATARHIWVTNVPDGLTEPTADLAWALMMAVARNVVAADRFVRTGAVAGWHARNFLGSNVHGKTLGLIGFGNIGRALARRARGFSMRVWYSDPQPASATDERELGVAQTALEELLARSDFLIVCAPLTEATYHVIDDRRLRAMKPSAYLVNVARGSLVNEAHVARALRDGIIAGYAADVFELEDRQIEARPRFVEPELIALADRVVLTPHVGTAVLEARVELARVQAQSVLEALRGERPATAVNDVDSGGGHTAASFKSPP